MSHPQNKPKEKKYRPVLTGGIIEHILSLCKRESPISSESFHLISILSAFQAKIQNDGVQEAYSSSPPKESMEVSLGMNLELGIPTPNRASKEEYWSMCHTKYSLAPETCTLEEIQGAQEHSYLEGLMSPEELKAFESGTNMPDLLKDQAE